MSVVSPDQNDQSLQCHTDLWIVKGTIKYVKKALNHMEETCCMRHQNFTFQIFQGASQDMTAAWSKKVLLSWNNHKKPVDENTYAFSMLKILTQFLCWKYLHIFNIFKPAFIFLFGSPLILINQETAYVMSNLLWFAFNSHLTRKQLMSVLWFSFNSHLTRQQLMFNLLWFSFNSNLSRKQLMSNSHWFPFNSHLTRKQLTSLLWFSFNFH